jgi:hypothetical protein
VDGQDKGERDANLVAAAEAAASWARARRTAWTSAPLGRPKPPRAAKQPIEPLPPIEFETPLSAGPLLTPQPAPPPPAPVIAPAPPAAAHSTPAVMAAAPPPPPRTTPTIASPASAPAPGPPPTRIVLAPQTPPASQPIALAPLTFEPREHERVMRAQPPPFVATSRDQAVAGDSSSSGSVTTWLARIAVAAAVVGALVVGWPYASNMLSSKSDKAQPKTATTSVPSKPDAKKTTGTLKIESTPAGAQVTVDGKGRGVTPLTLNDVPTGKHEVVLKSNAGTVRRTVTIAANQAESIDEQIFSGWVNVYSPFEVTVAEGSRVLTADDRNQVMLAPGIHELRLANKALGYEAVLQVDVKPGQSTPVRLTPPPSSLTVTAPEAAEVVVDGVRAGDTPLNGFAIALGTHDVVVRRGNGSGRRYTITIGVKPFTLNAEF